MKYFNNIQFKFKLVPTLVFLTFFVLFIRLGFWQLDRAEQKRIINDQYKSRQETTIVDLNTKLIKITIPFYGEKPKSMVHFI